MIALGALALVAAIAVASYAMIFVEIARSSLDDRASLIIAGISLAVVAFVILAVLAIGRRR